MNYLILTTISICLWISRAHTQSIDDVNPVEEMVWLSDLVKDTLYVRIVLPKVYHRTDTTYPIILHLDSDVSLDLITSISNWLTLTGKINPMIIVGIAYKKDWQQKRARDMTPVRGDPAFQESRPQSGKADNFLGALQEELYPALEKYRIDWHNKTLTGHSLGGLLAFYTIISRPAIFDKYLLVAPAVNWYDDYALQLIDNMNETYNSSIHVFSAAGMEDRPELISAWETLNDRMTGAYSYLKWRTISYPGLDHFTVVPVAFMEGMIALHGK